MSERTAESAIVTEPRELMRSLLAALGPTSWRHSPAQGVNVVKSWAADQGDTPSPWSAERLRFAVDLWHRIAGAEDPDTARAWFVGANPARWNTRAPVHA